LSAAGAYRLAGPADVPALAALYADCALRLGPLVYTPEQVSAWASFGRDTPAFRDYVLGARTWIADDAAGVLGFCGIGAGGEVHSLYVRAGATRRGTGGALLAHALAMARADGITRFEAWATPFSLAVFARAGFRLVRSVTEDYQGVAFERYRVALG
jgi:GNAT superfamily N-acetyltransferase